MSLPTPNLSKFKRLVWPKFMLPLVFLLTDKVFPEISLCDNLIIAKIKMSETFFSNPPPPPPKQAKKTFPVAKSICETSLTANCKYKYYLLVVNNQIYYALN